MANTMHEYIKERCDLAHTYAEDGAYSTAATILEQLARKVREHADKVIAGEQPQRFQADVAEPSG